MENSNYTGVYWTQDRRRWRAEITKEGVRHRLGSFRCQHEAARAYNEKAKELYGDKAILNKVPDNV